MLVFFDVYEGKLDPFRGVTLRGHRRRRLPARGLALDDRDRVDSLLYYFRHLDSTDPDVAADAFLEFAKATDQEVGAVAAEDSIRPGCASFSPIRRRRPNGSACSPSCSAACGTKADADTLAALLDKPTTDRRRP